jgi:hypothetical protein
MAEPLILAGRSKIITSKDRIFPLLSKKNMSNWICVYEQENYNDAETLYNCLSKASNAYGLSILEPLWIEMRPHSKPAEWIQAVEEYFKENTNFLFVIFLLGKNNNNHYEKLKKHSLCTNGYVSQVIKTKSLKSKGMMSTCSKILLQINAK